MTTILSPGRSVAASPATRGRRPRAGDLDRGKVEVFVARDLSAVHFTTVGEVHANAISVFAHDVRVREQGVLGHEEAAPHRVVAAERNRRAASRSRNLLGRKRSAGALARNAYGFSLGPSVARRKRPQRDKGCEQDARRYANPFHRHVRPVDLLRFLGGRDLRAAFELKLHTSVKRGLGGLSRDAVQNRRPRRCEDALDLDERRRR